MVCEAARTYGGKCATRWMAESWTGIILSVLGQDDPHRNFVLPQRNLPANVPLNQLAVHPTTPSPTLVLGKGEMPNCADMSTF